MISTSRSSDFQISGSAISSHKNIQSVIVTVHNSEQYLRRCLDSVCNQTYKDIEIICLDGGSKDKSPEILKEYAKIDNRIRIINDSNTSYGHKVNVGIERSLVLCQDLVQNKMRGSASLAAGRFSTLIYSFS